MSEGVRGKGYIYTHINIIFKKSHTHIYMYIYNIPCIPQGRPLECLHNERPRHGPQLLVLLAPYVVLWVVGGVVMFRVYLLCVFSFLPPMQYGIVGGVVVVFRVYVLCVKHVYYTSSAVCNIHTHPPPSPIYIFKAYIINCTYHRSHSNSTPRPPTPSGPSLSRPTHAPIYFIYLFIL